MWLVIARFLLAIICFVVWLSRGSRSQSDEPLSRSLTSELAMSSDHQSQTELVRWDEQAIAQQLRSLSTKPALVPHFIDSLTRRFVL